jgi:hypothetical protein
MKMQYRLETEIHKPLHDVVRLFTDRSQYPKWQPGLVSMDPVPNTPNPTYQLLMQFGRRKMKMKEVILENNLPASYTVHYTTKGVENHVHITFETISPTRTRYISHEEFRFKGLMNLVARFMQDGFKKQSEIIMHNFKRYAERA